MNDIPANVFADPEELERWLEDIRAEPSDEEMVEMSAYFGYGTINKDNKDEIRGIIKT